MALRNEPATEINLIGVGTVVEGKVRTPGSIKIDGRVVGEVVATQNILVGSSGDVDGNLSAKTITVGGKVKGSIAAQEKLVLEGKSVVRGDMRAVKLVIDEGAVFDGKCMMSEAKSAPNLMELKSEARAAEDR